VEGERARDSQRARDADAGVHAAPCVGLLKVMHLATAQMSANARVTLPTRCTFVVLFRKAGQVFYAAAQ